MLLIQLLYHVQIRTLACVLCYLDFNFWFNLHHLFLYKLMILSSIGGWKGWLGFFIPMSFGLCRLFIPLQVKDFV